VTPDEITMLTKLYRLLGLEEADVYSQVHAFEAGDVGPVTVRRAAGVRDRWSIPPQPIESREVELDQARIAARREETAAVSALLSDIFVEDDDEAVPAPSDRPPSPIGSIAGLDMAHANFVGLLRPQPSWDRADLETLAEAHGLPMLDAAIDRINDAVIEACGEPLIEGDDPLEINGYALQGIA
jgi:hypothetical protein